jgi:hypothetical protein
MDEFPSIAIMAIHRRLSRDIEFPAIQLLATIQQLPAIFIQQATSNNTVVHNNGRIKRKKRNGPKEEEIQGQHANA